MEPSKINEYINIVTSNNYDDLCTFIDNNHNFDYNNPYFTGSTLYYHALNHISLNFSYDHAMNIINKLANLNVPFLCYRNIRSLPYLSSLNPDALQKLTRKIKNLPDEPNLILNGDFILQTVEVNNPSSLSYVLQLNVKNNINNISMISGKGILHSIVSTNDPTSLSSLINNTELCKHVDPNIKDEYGMTPLVRMMYRKKCNIHLDGFLETFKDKITLGNFMFTRLDNIFNSKNSDLDILLVKKRNNHYLNEIIENMSDDEFSSIATEHTKKIALEKYMLNPTSLNTCIINKFISVDEKFKKNLIDATRTEDRSRIVQFLSVSDVINLLEKEKFDTPDKSKYLYSLYNYIIVEHADDPYIIEFLEKSNMHPKLFLIGALDCLDHELLECVFDTTQTITFDQDIYNSLKKTSSQCKKTFIEYIEFFLKEDIGTKLSDVKQYVTVETIPKPFLKELYESSKLVKETIDVNKDNIITLLSQDKSGMDSIIYCPECSFSANAVTNCGHFTCLECYRKKINKTCSTCRQIVTNVIKIYPS